MDPAARRSTIDDVARAAGVSHQTVSNVLHDRGRMGAATRERVRAAIEALDYRPHAGAAGLRSRRSGRIAHSLPAAELASTNLVMLEFVQALTVAAGQRGQRLLLATDVQDLQDLVRTGAVDAVILAAVAVRDPRVELLTRRGVPFAAFGRTAPDRPQSWVNVDNRAATEDLTGRLLARGHTPAFLGYEAQGPWDTERQDGYRAAMRAAGRPALIRTAPVDPAAVVAAIGQLLDRRPVPSALVTGSDTLAAAVYAEAARRGRRIGMDLAVTGFDGSLVGRLLTPELCTLSIPAGLIARRLVERVLREIDGPTGDPGELLMPSLIPGASAGPLS